MSDSKLLRIFALGGNEVSPTGQVDPKTGKMINPDLKSQWQRAAATCELIAGIVKNAPDNYYILTHGNGPQVGNILLRSELASKELHPLTLDVCGADSQGAMGYMLAQLSNYLRLKGVNKIAAETVTQVVVDEQDPDFKDPSKFIGSALTKDEAFKKRDNEGWIVKMYKKNERGEEVWRRVVPSPKPSDIVELDLIELNMKAGMIPITVGGGGIPVRKVKPQVVNGKEVYKGTFDVHYERVLDDKNKDKPANIYAGVEAVIDKDLASALLGVLLKKRAEARGEKLDVEFTIFTDVDGAKLNFGKPDQVDLKRLTLSEAKKLYNDGLFPAGSMGPKILAAINFVEGGGTKAYISKVSLFEKTIKGEAGTVIVRD